MDIISLADVIEPHRQIQSPEVRTRLGLASFLKRVLILLLKKKRKKEKRLLIHF